MEEKCFLWSVSVDFRERLIFNLADGIVCSIFIHVCNLEATGLPGILVKNSR